MAVVEVEYSFSDLSNQEYTCETCRFYGFEWNMTPCESCTKTHSGYTPISEIEALKGGVMVNISDTTPKVYNMPWRADSYKCVVAREDGGKLWYWGAYNSVNKASVVANSIGGVVLDKWERAD